MQISISLVLLFSFLPAFGLAMPAAAPKASSTAKAASSPLKAPAQASASSSADTSPSDTQIKNAVQSWRNDTGKVSKFLNTATSFSGDEFTKQATIALNAELDELNHKMVLDAAFGQTDAVKKANDTLATKGTFQAVVDVLQSMVDNGPDTAQAQVDAINKNRCVNVLPNIDAYFAAAGSPDLQAIRPSGCLEIENAGASASPSSVASGKSSTTPAPKAAATGNSTSGSASKVASNKTSSASASTPSADVSQDENQPAGVVPANGASNSTESATSAAKALLSKSSSAAKAPSGTVLAAAATGKAGAGAKAPKASSTVKA